MVPLLTQAHGLAPAVRPHGPRSGRVLVIAAERTTRKPKSYAQYSGTLETCAKGHRS